MRSIQAVKYVSRRAGQPISALFDVIAGTSTGAIQALALSVAGLSPVDIEQMYLKRAGEIFDKRFWSLGGMVGPKYNASSLESVLKDTLGDLRYHKASIPTLAMAYDIHARLPVAMTSWGAHGDKYAWEVARASSAGPTFFAPYKHYIDGGTVCNNPTIMACIEAAKLFGCKVEDCSVLSVGTGAGEDPVDGNEAAGWGALKWVTGPLISIFTDGVSDTADYQAAELLPKEQYLRIQARASGALAEMDNVTPENLLALRQAGNQDVGARLVEIGMFVDRLKKS